jgi:cytochrome P450
VLTCLFYQLAVVPKSLSALQQEIDDAFNTIDVIDSTALSKLPYLDAVVNETLRLHPPIPSGFQRMTPPEGLQVGEKFIPGESIVQIPLHTLYRGTLSLTTYY